MHIWLGILGVQIVWDFPHLRFWGLTCQVNGRFRIT